jgi:hypothetical protein
LELRWGRASTSTSASTYADSYPNSYADAYIDIFIIEHDTFNHLHQCGVFFG